MNQFLALSTGLIIGLFISFVYKVSKKTKIPLKISKKLFRQEATIVDPTDILDIIDI